MPSTGASTATLLAIKETALSPLADCEGADDSVTALLAVSMSDVGGSATSSCSSGTFFSAFLAFPTCCFAAFFDGLAACLACKEGDRQLHDDRCCRQMGQILGRKCRLGGRFSSSTLAGTSAKTDLLCIVSQSQCLELKQWRYMAVVMTPGSFVFLTFNQQTGKC